MLATAHRLSGTAAMDHRAFVSRIDITKKKIMHVKRFCYSLHPLNPLEVAGSIVSSAKPSIDMHFHELRIG